MSDDSTSSRRRFIHLAGVTAATVGLAGCSSNGGDGGDGGDTTGGTQGTVEPVPDQYATATALGGNKRDPDAVSSQSAVNYQLDPKNGQKCSGCLYYIPDKNGDGAGACAIVEGIIQPDAYCVSYAPYQG